MHLLIPFASSLSAACQHALATLKLPNLDKLLGQMTPASTDRADETTLTPPHERTLAAAYGISAPGVTPDGQLPWGAWHAAQAGHPVAADEAWAVITPCHWAVQTGHITMIHPRALGLMEDESRALLAAMQAYFSGDGITLVYATPTRWLARGEVFAGLSTASPYRVVGTRVDDWIPKGNAAKTLRRLQQEMQMLLYTHPLTDARVDRGLLAINSFWVSGTGSLSARQLSLAHAHRASPPAVFVPNGPRDAAIIEDWNAWAAAWARIDASECKDLLAASQSGQDVTLTLCGEKSSQTFQTGKKSALGRFKHQIDGLLGRLPLSTLLKQL